MLDLSATKLRGITILLLLAGIGLPLAARADEGDDAGDAETADEAEDRQSANATEAAVKRLLKSLENEHDDVWIFRPIYQRKVTGHEEVERRFTKKVVTRPVYKHEKKPYMKRVIIRDENGYIVGTKLEKAYRHVRSHKIGEKKVTRVVPDAKGEIVRTIKRPIYGEGGPTILSGEWLGNNALALLALLDAGMDEESEQALDLVDAISDHVKSYGLPDRTRELALVTMALCEVTPERHKQSIERAVVKLLAGQVTRGDASGLWGPLCVNRDRLRFGLQLGEQINKVIEESKPKKKEEEPSARYSEAVELRRKLMEKLVLEVGRETFWRPLDPVTRAIQMQAVVVDGEDRPSVIVPGLTYNVLKEDRVDIVSTYFAISALAKAHQKGLLPTTLAPIEYVAGQRSRERPIATRDVVMRAVQALFARLAREGAWSDLVAAQDANGRAMPTSRALSRQTTLTTHAMGLLAARRALTLPGANVLARRYQKLLDKAREKGMELVRDLPEASADNATAKNRTIVPWLVDDEAPESKAGGRLSPLDALMFAVQAGLVEPKVAAAWDVVISTEATKRALQQGHHRSLVMVAPSSVRLEPELASRLEKAGDNKNKNRSALPRQWYSRYWGTNASRLADVYTICLIKAFEAQLTEPASDKDAGSEETDGSVSKAPVEAG